MPSFSDFSLQSATLNTLTNMEITEPTPIQAEAIPALLAGRDLIGQSATGSGKTLAYSIPLVERLSSNRRVVQALVLVPTRELAVQVNAVLSKLPLIASLRLLYWWVAAPTENKTRPCAMARKSWLVRLDA